MLIKEPKTTSTSHGTIYVDGRRETTDKYRGKAFVSTKQLEMSTNSYDSKSSGMRHFIPPRGMPICVLLEIEEKTKPREFTWRTGPNLVQSNLTSGLIKETCVRLRPKAERPGIHKHEQNTPTCHQTTKSEGWRRLQSSTIITRLIFNEQS